MRPSSSRELCALLFCLGLLSSLASGQVPPTPPATESNAPAPNEAPPSARSGRPDFADLGGFGGGGGLGGPMGAPFPRAGYRGLFVPSQPVGGQPADFTMWVHDLNLSLPVWKNERQLWSVSASVHSEWFDTDAILPSTGQPFPEELWDVRLGAGFRHQFDNGWSASANVTFGSASDEPFQSVDELTAGVQAFLLVPRGERNRWIFSLVYNTNSQIPFPIPGVSYFWQPSDQFSANIGLPFFVSWRPTEELSFDLSYMILTRVRAQASYRPWKPVRFYAGYAFENESFLRAERLEQEDQFFYLNQLLFAGAQVFVSRQASLDLSTGYVFDRRYFESRTVASGNDFNRVDVGAGPFVAFQVRVRW